MTKLKTLKDFIGDWGYDDDGTPDEDVVSVEQLKQEAIKDIKSFQENPYSLFNKWGKIESKAVIEYIKWKFNITERDLK